MSSELLRLFSWVVSVLSRLPAPISWVALKIHNYLCCVMYVRIQVSRDEKGINNLNPLNLSPVSRFLNCKWGWRLWAAGGGEGKLNSTKVFSSNEKFKNLNSVRAVFQFLHSPCSWTHETLSLVVSTKFPIKLQACVLLYPQTKGRTSFLTRVRVNGRKLTCKFENLIFSLSAKFKG